jgi:hypothetical protein
MRSDGEVVTAQAEFPDELQRMHRARLEAMGEASTYDLSPSSTESEQLVAAEKFLSEPLVRLAVGCLPGRGSGSPPGFKEATQLVAANSVAALRRILRGSNPEGRGYAAVALSKLDSLSTEDLRVIERLKNTSTVATQGGCMVTISPAREFYTNLQRLHYLFDQSDSPRTTPDGE